MLENPEYWNTIATVIPVIALTYATALKRGDWHRMKAATRRWIALYGAALVGSLVWVESLALEHLQEKTTDAGDERLSLIVITWAAAQVLAVPIAPLLVIAVHDLHPKVVRAKRAQRADERQLDSLRREYDGFNKHILDTLGECRLDGLEQVLAKPDLVYDQFGAVRGDYIQRVPPWAFVRDFRLSTDEARGNLEQELTGAEKQLKKSRKRLAKVLRTLTKKTAEMTDLHR